jgi:hypothetical protein
MKIIFAVGSCLNAAGSNEKATFGITEKTQMEHFMGIFYMDSYDRSI